MTNETPPGFWKHISTDYDNKTFDTGRVIVIMVILSMMALEAWDVLMHAAKFDPQAYGAGVAAILAGLGAYIFGDNTKRPDRGGGDDDRGRGGGDDDRGRGGGDDDRGRGGGDDDRGKIVPVVPVVNTGA